MENNEDKILKTIEAYEDDLINIIEDLNKEEDYIKFYPDIGLKSLTEKEKAMINSDLKILSGLLDNDANVYLDYKKENSIINEINENNLIEWFSEDEYIRLKNEIENAGKERAYKLREISVYLEQKKPKLFVDDFSKFDLLSKNLKNFTEVINYFKGSFLLNQSKTKGYSVTNPILLLGEPGIGKTYFAKELAKILKTTCAFIDANSITANWVLSGSGGQWQNADCGNIFKYMNESNTVSPIVIFDEIDKLSQGKNYDTTSTFHQLLEKENSSFFKDEYLNVSFDASNIIYILTANSTKNIPDSLLSRMTVFDIKNPSKEDLRVIAQNIYQEIIGDSNLFNHLLSENSLLILENLVPRNIKSILNKSIYTQLAKEEISENKNLIISNEEVDKIKLGF